MTDILLYQSIDDGEINVLNGVMETTDGLETAVYLALFGGNEEDDGSQDNPFNWWGNFDEPDPTKRYRSETQYILRSLPLSLNNLKRIGKAAERDLKFLISTDVAKSIEVIVGMPGLNKISISVKIISDSGEKVIEFSEVIK